MSMLRVIAAMASKNWTAPEPPPPGDTTPPQVASMVATNATTIRVAFDEPTTATLPGWMFSNGSPVTPSAVTQVNATTWDFTVSGLAHGQTITGSYDAIEGETVDVAGNELASFTGASVTNSIPAPGDTTPPTVVTAVVEDDNPNRVVLTFSESVTATINGWSFTRAGSPWTISSLSGSGTTWTFTMDGNALNGETIQRSYNASTGATVDAAGNELGAFSNGSVTNNVTPAGPQILYAYVESPESALLEVAFDTTMDANSEPAANRFTIPGHTVVAVNVGTPWPANWLNLQVTPDFTPGEQIFLSYLRPTLNPLRSSVGVEVKSFSNLPVSNLLSGGGGGDTTPPTVISRTAISGNAIRVVFSEAVTASVAGWSFNNGSPLTPSSVNQINGTTWDFIVSGLTSAQTITASYNNATGVTVDGSGNELATFTGASVDNQVPPPGTGDALTFTAIPYSDPEIRRPGAGAEDWQGSNTVDIPTEGSPQLAKDFYVRSWFTWAELESTQGTYDFAGVIGPYINLAIDRGQKFGFGIMTIYDDGGENIVTSPEDQGAGMSYPLYVHNAMQALPANESDFIRSGWWIPNYNAAIYLDRLDALHQALNTWLQNNSRNGVTYANAIGYIDIRGFGNYGEWHHAGYIDAANQSDGSAGSWPTGRRPTVASLQRIVDSHCNNLPGFQLVAMIAILDCQALPNTWNPPGIATYMLEKTYGGGKRIGIRRDNWASTDAFISQWMENNDRATINGQPISATIMDRWRVAPINGEPYNFGDGGVWNGSAYVSDNQEYETMEAEVQFYNVVSFGNGNFNWSNQWSSNSANKTYIRAASKRAGFRLKLNSGSLTANIVRNTPFSLSLTWANDGVSPTYENWDVDIELRSGSTVVWSAQSSAVLRLFLPGTMVVNDGFTIPTSVAAGTYNLHLIIRNTEWPARLMPLHNVGVQGDGSYILKSNLTIT